MASSFPEPPRHAQFFPFPHSFNDETSCRSDATTVRLSNCQHLEPEVSLPVRAACFEVGLSTCLFVPARVHVLLSCDGVDAEIDRVAYPVVLMSTPIRPTFTVPVVT